MSKAWPVTSLSELATITMGQSPESSRVNNAERGLPFLQGCAEFGARVPIANLHCSPPLRIAKSGSVLISVRAPVGTTNFADQDYCIGRGLGAVAAKQEAADNIFLLHAIEQNVDFLHRRSQGSTFLAIGSKELSALPVPALALDTQRRIAEILSTLDETIEQTEALIAKYQQIKSGLMHDLFTRGITPNGKLRPTRAEAPQLYKDSPLGWIPKEWEIESLASVGEVVDSLHRTPQFETEGFPMVRVTDITGGELELSSCVKVNKSTYEEFTTGHKPRAGDIVLSRVGTYGIASYVSTQEPFCMGQNTVIITKLPNPYFVFQFLGSNSARNQFDQAVAGSSQKTLSLAAIKKSLVPWPEKTEREIIDKVFHAVNEQLFNLRLSLKKLRQQKHGLMHDLLTGRVRVKVADS